jgi:hypothetical protein
MRGNNEPSFVLLERYSDKYNYEAQEWYDECSVSELEYFT